jgi:hypothetical protein
VKRLKMTTFKYIIILRRTHQNVQYINHLINYLISNKTHREEIKILRDHWCLPNSAKLTVRIQYGLNKASTEG